MINYMLFINQKIMNKNGEEGVVISFVNERVIVSYSGAEKTYNPEVAFGNGFLSFVDDKFAKLYQDEMIAKKAIAKIKEETIKKIDENRPIKIKRVNEIYAKLSKKYSILQVLFGKDLFYPPYEKFVKEYKDLINTNPRKRSYSYYLSSNDYMYH